MSAKITFGKKVVAGGDAFVGNVQAVKIEGAKAGTSPVIPEIRAAGQQESSSEITFKDDLQATGDTFIGTGHAMKVSYQEKSEHRDLDSATQSRTGGTIAEARDRTEPDGQPSRTFSSGEP